MNPLTFDEIRSSFVNCTKGEASRLRTPAGFDKTPWGHLDFFGWRDPGAPGVAYLVAPSWTLGRDREADGVVALVLRLAPERRASGRKNMCSLCTTTHSTTDVALMVAPRPGAAGRQGNTVGTYLCADLACSFYVRGLKRPARVQPVETLSVKEKVARLQVNLDDFLRRVLG